MTERLRPLASWRALTPALSRKRERVKEGYLAERRNDRQEK
jgi:hypothetical protein